MTLAFVTTGSGPVRLAVHDLAGRELRRLADGPLPAARHARDWDLRDPEGRAVPSGVYLAVLEDAGRRTVRRLVVIR